MLEVTLAIFNMGYFAGQKWFWQDIARSPADFIAGFAIYFSVSATYMVVFLLRGADGAYGLPTLVALILNTSVLVLHHLYVFRAWSNRIRQEKALRSQPALSGGDGKGGDASQS